MLTAATTSSPQRILLIFALAIAIILPIAILGIPTGNDITQHYQFALTYQDSLKHGIVFPTWTAASNSGLGDAGIRLYPPFSHYLLAIFDLLLGDWYAASVLSFALLMFLSGLGVYLWGRELFDDNSALFAAAIYIIVPYHLNQIYNAFLYAEFAAAAILPFCFLFVDRVSRRSSPSGCIGLGVSYALLILTHLPTAMLASLGLLIYSLVRVRSEKTLSAVYRLSAGAILGLAASSFYWIRVITELSFVKHVSGEYTSGTYDFHANFLGNSIFASVENIAPSVWFVDMMFLITLGLFVPGLILVLASNRSDIRKFLPLIAVFFFALILATPVSLPLWERIRILQMTQFPWRAMTLISLSAAIFAGAGLRSVIASYRSSWRPVGFVAVGLTLVGAAFSIAQVIRPAILVPRAEFNQNVAAWVARPTCECWWPVWTTKQAFDDPRSVTAATREISLNSSSAAERRFSIQSGDPTPAEVGIFYYPFWTAQINGQPVTVSIGETGKLEIPVPAETADVELLFVEPVFERAARWISILVWAFIALYLAFLLLQKKRREVTDA